MKVTFAHLCDYALRGGDGKLSVMGIFSTIHAESFPAVHPMAFVAFEVELESAEVGGEVGGRLQVRDADGQELATFDMQIESRGEPPPGSTVKVGAILPLRNMRFEKPGSYEFAFFWGGRFDRSIPLEVGQRDADPNQTTDR